MVWKRFLVPSSPYPISWSPCLYSFLLGLSDMQALGNLKEIEGKINMWLTYWDNSIYLQTYPSKDHLSLISANLYKYKFSWNHQDGKSSRDFSGLLILFFFFFLDSFLMILVLIFWNEHFDVNLRHANASFLLELSEMGLFPSYFCCPFWSSHRTVQIQAPYLATKHKKKAESIFSFMLF